MFETKYRSYHHGSAETNLISIHEDTGSTPAQLSGLRIRLAKSCGVGHRPRLDLVLLWLWYRPAASALI